MPPAAPCLHYGRVPLPMSEALCFRCACQFAVYSTEPVGQLRDGQCPRGFHDGALAVDSIRLDGVQPGVFIGQPGGENADPAPPLFDLAVVVADPGVGSLTGVP
jgi:hypothetical protein